MNRLPKSLAAIIAGMCVFFAATVVHAGLTRPTYATAVRVTPGASPTMVAAFQNTSSGLDVLVHKIEIVNATTMTVTGGGEQFWLYTSTSLTHSTRAGDTIGYGSALVSTPTYISMSTAPTSVLIENNSQVLTSSMSVTLAGRLPVIAPLIVDGDDAATVNRYGAWTPEDSTADAASPFVLPAGANRALVIEKRQGAATDFTAGSYYIRVFYTVR